MRIIAFASTAGFTTPCDARTHRRAGGRVFTPFLRGFEVRAAGWLGHLVHVGLAAVVGGTHAAAFALGLEPGRLVRVAKSIWGEIVPPPVFPQLSARNLHYARLPRAVSTYFSDPLFPDTFPHPACPADEAEIIDDNVNRDRPPPPRPATHLEPPLLDTRRAGRFFAVSPAVAQLDPMFAFPLSLQLVRLRYVTWNAILLTVPRIVDTWSAVGMWWRSRFAPTVFYSAWFSRFALGWKQSHA